MVYLGIMVTDQGIPLVDPYNSAFFGELAARYLLSKGHRNLAFIGPEAIGNGVIMHRLQGFCSYLREAGIQLPSEHIINLTGQNMEDILKMLKKLLIP